MRIFLASIGMRGPGGQPGLWARNLVPALVRLGHEIVTSRVDWDEPTIPLETPGADATQRRARSRALVNEVSEAHAREPLDLVLTYLYSAHVEASAIETIRKLAVPTVNFYCNGAHQFHLVEEIAPAFDHCWVPERMALPYYRRAGARPLHIQMGAEPTAYHPVPAEEGSVPVLFIGQLYADRAEVIGELLRKGVDVHVHSRAHPPASGGVAPSRPTRSLYGEAFEDLRTHGPFYLARRARRFVARRAAMRRIHDVARPPPNDAEMLRLFSAADIVLSFANVYDFGLPGGALKAHVRLRDFEVPLCRALYFPQWSPEIGEYYDTEREVVAWRTTDELARKIERFQADPGLRERVREAGYQRALRDHTWDRRYAQLFKLIGVA